MSEDVDYAKLLADDAVAAAAQNSAATFATAKAITSITYALTGLTEVAQKLLVTLERLTEQIPDDIEVVEESEEDFIERMIAENSIHPRTGARVCSSCGYGQSDTDAIDWDVIYGHESCKNPKCPTHQRSD